ncbi:sensor domain-containing diguanylate cyclase [Enterobacter sp. C2]|uniref:sensor domain-containing diguanylate cyclase n=1 Tax=Enterobacter sp. C2 TaxID=2870346 RepID=UPI001CA3E479|nr:sensor domain-containing diguanylate cyclase [Enterobacter sp. C2]
MSDIILARVSETLASEQTVESLVRQLLEMLELVSEMESTYLTKIDTDARLQHILYARNSKQMNIPEGLSVPWGDTLCKRALDDECFFSNDVATLWGDCGPARALGIKTYLSSPVHLADGTLYGTLCAASTETHALNVRANQVLQLFAGLISQAIQKESLVAQLREANAALISHSYTDALTGLPNRRAIFDNLSTLFSLARHLDVPVIIAFIDLDNFKSINDSFGHDVGDLFLVQVGQRIIRQCDGNDIAGRLGGDEFMLACLGSARGKSDEAYLRELKARLSGHIIGDYSLGDIRIYYPGASIGIVEIDPTQTDADTALRMADVAMYQEKKGRQKSPFVVLD